LWVVSSGDYSYGIYLYGYPIQQAIAATFPAHEHWYISLPIALTAVFGIASLSWHFVEKLALRLRRLLYRLEAPWAPYNDAIHAFCAGLLPAGLRSRWLRS
jgi:peptidoglycan/LPS O-acetylase OafA/YrhL